MEYKRSHLTYFISGGLVISFLLSLTGSFFPSESLPQTIFFKIDALFAISAFSCLAAKTSTEKYDIPSAGFGVLAIAQGLFLSEIDHANDWNYQTASIGTLFMIPAVIMISYYPLFPKWLRIGGIISIIPFLILLIFRLTSGFKNTSEIETIIFLLYQTVTLCWAWQIWKKRHVNTEQT